jgi:EmrB/QacA subfamily drug resistance transporter
MPQSNRGLWTFVVTSVVLFMVQLDNLVVTTALPTIRVELHASLASLEWTVNAYTLTFACLLLTGAALGDRFGRKRFFIGGLVLFTLASAGAAMSTTATQLDVARAVQGVGAAILTPLTLTLLSASVSPARRALALGAWGAVGGLGIAVGPVIGGAIVDGASWQWIFWVNVPLGVILLPIAAARLTESRGAPRRLDVLGTVLASVALFGIVLALVRGSAWGWNSRPIVGLFAAGGALLGVFIAWEMHSDHPMLPLRLFRSRSFSLINASSLLLSFGLFGSIFLLAQFFQVAQGRSALDAGVLTLPWTGLPAVVAPLAAMLSGRLGGQRVVSAGLALQAGGLAWLAAVSTPTVAYRDLFLPFVMCGLGLGLFFAPVANLVLSSVARNEEGIASGTNNAIRQLGGVLGVAVLAAIFAHYGSYGSPDLYAAGAVPAVRVGAAVVAVGAVLSLFIPPVRRPTADAAENTAAPAAPREPRQPVARRDLVRGPLADDQTVPLREPEARLITDQGGSP